MDHFYLLTFIYWDVSPRGGPSWDNKLFLQNLEAYSLIVEPVDGGHGEE